MSCKTINIRKGRHTTKRVFKFGIGRNFSMRRLVTFDESCKYTLHYPDYLDINKLFGFSDGFNHHSNSIRVGWRRNLNQGGVDLFHYQYLGGRRFKEFLCNVGYDVPVEISIETRDNLYLTIVKGKGFCYQKLSSREKKSWFHYYLYVYFGGNLPAPQDMNIKICKI